ncbi:MAG: prephenate dehydrogenase/arogenate dehydrogenase family protein [Acidobacteria bacterium]|nr:prephenate dehydrogenase/arogenate dehydrogenase family protein [Acidobacteriota bacterium]
MQTVTIVGVGLIGGSFALGLRRCGFRGRLIGVDPGPSLSTALARGVVDESLPLEQAVPQSDLIYLAIPIGRILELLPTVAPLVRPTALVTDAGSTKGEIVMEADRLFTNGAVFLGGHPMAGKAERGVEAAEPNLFRGATYVLTPAEDSLPSAAPVEEFCRWLERLGARLLVMPAQAHDRIVAFTSHLPQMASTALASVVLEQMSSPDSWKVAGSGLRDTTRLAASAYDLWRDICLTNTKNIDRALTAYIQKLEHLRENLRQRALEEDFRRGAKFVAQFQEWLQF